MAFLKPSWGLLGALALIVVLSLSGVAVQTARLGASQASERAVRADLELAQSEISTLRAASARRQATNAKQSTERAKAAQAVQAVREQNRKEEDEAPEPRPTLSDTQLVRLRRLQDASNAAIRGASELPGGS